MWLQSSEAREIFDTDLTKTIGIDAAEIEKFRRELAAVPSATLVKFWFGAQRTSEPTTLEKHLREKLRTRAALFSWVHGPGTSIARDLLYVKLPSSEKRRLVNLLLASLRSRMPWIESRLIHAMAFRPAELNRVAEKTVGKTKGFQQWGPLYRGVKIGKRRGYRQLWIPNTPLKATQGALLRLIAPGLARVLQPFVFGASSGRRGPTFENAAAHLGKAYVATFDLRDFFPSTRVGDVIRGIQWAADHGHLLVDETRVPSYLEENPQVRSLRWTDDAMVLVARLATYRARLPQGSPLSPLLANVAFARFDERILDALGREFGKREFAYTRYFDDLTISLSGAAARDLGLKQTSTVRDRIEQKLQEVLEGSSFALNASKSRCTALTVERRPAAGKTIANSLGHHVTGVILRRESVELTRDLKRELRTTIHRLKHRDFVEDARVWHQSKNFLPPAFKSLSKGHRWEGNTIISRRCSAERLSVLMLRHFHPELRVRAILREWYPWQERFIGGEQVRRGKQAWPLIEWLLAALWEGTVTARRHGDNTIRFSQGGVAVCDVEAESALQFFLLAKESAIAVTEYWHHLQGLKGYLGACPIRPEFSDIIEWRDRLVEAMSALEIRGYEIEATEPIVENTSDGDPEPLTVSDRVKERSDRFIVVYREFARRMSIAGDTFLGTCEDAARVVATNSADFDRWISAIRGLFVTRLPRLPAVVEHRDSFDRRRLFDAVRVWDDGTKRLVADDYQFVADLRVALKIDRLDSEDTYQFARAQLRLFDWLLASFERSTETRRCGIGEVSALDRGCDLPVNLWSGTLKERLAEAFEELVSAHEVLRSSDGETKLFIQRSGEELHRERETIRCTEQWNNDRAWEHLCQVARVLFITTQESVEPSLWRDPVEDDQPVSAQNELRRKKTWKGVCDRVDSELRHRARLLAKLRNRDAHKANDDRRAEWCSIQADVARILGRSWESTSGRKHPQFHAKDDLELFGHEVTVVKLELIRSLTALFNRAAELQVWRPEHGMDR
ncbi:MAG: hypothetical protein EXS10_10575 [Phycisphaerales bacterium]|nr:hypothetical protein [Phycisphaerales bacterium]